MSSFPPKIWAQDNTAATTCQPPLCHALSLPLGAAAAPCPRRLLQTDTRTVSRHLRSQQGSDAGSPFPTLLLKC